MFSNTHDPEDRLCTSSSWGHLGELLPGPTTGMVEMLADIRLPGPAGDQQAIPTMDVPPAISL